MNLLLAIAIGVLVAVGVLQLFQRDVVRLVVGFYIFWNAANLLLIGVSRVPGARAPIVGESTGPLADPLVQALVLTAIVISFGFTAFLVALMYWLVERDKSINLDEYRNSRE